MKWLNDYRIRIVLIGVIVAIVLIGGNAKADLTFGEPTNLGSPVNGSSFDADVELSADGLELYFASYNRPGGYGHYDIWVARQETIGDDWGSPVNLGPTINTSAMEVVPDLSADGLSLYFLSDRPGGAGGDDIWVTTRATEAEPWGNPVNLGPTVNSPVDDGCASISANGLELFFASNRAGGYGARDIWVTTRPTEAEPWGEPVNLGPTINSSYDDADTEISADGLVLLFNSYRPDGFGSYDVWMTRRTTTNDAWEEPVNLGPMVNSSTREATPGLSQDGSTLYFSSERPGGFGNLDIWQAPIIPIVDFNGDGIVDSADMCIMVDHWGENYSLCDIGPMPWGDGIVDVEDLKVLAEYLFEEVNDPTLVAHWPLDEVQGDIAYNNAASCNGTLIGDPVWQPDGGIIAGALQFNGINDYVSTDLVLNPSDGAFSVIAWIEGGAPGQVIFSQAGGSNWLCLDSVEGYLMTELKGSGRSAGPLMSQTIIADGNWHRIDFVWDGSHRRLYVDSNIVAEDEHNELVGSNGSLYIGCGKSGESGSFFSGLIDDVRIYNRVVNP